MMYIKSSKQINDKRYPNLIPVYLYSPMNQGAVMFNGKLVTDKHLLVQDMRGQIMSVRKDKLVDRQQNKLKLS